MKITWLELKFKLSKIWKTISRTLFYLNKRITILISRWRRPRRSKEKRPSKTQAKTKKRRWMKIKQSYGAR